MACTVKNNVIYGNDYGVGREENTSTTITGEVRAEPLFENYPENDFDLTAS